MRYVLYEASNKTILLSREVQFLKNYIALMSLRYTNKVSIQMDFPVEVPEVQIPPLLFVSFVENAFKHGVSYRSESFIHVLMQLDEATGFHSVVPTAIMVRLTNSIMASDSRISVSG